MAESAKPLPQITPLTQPFWEATANKRLVIQRCSNCGVFVWCPHPSCTECGSDSLEWKPVSGHGTVFSFTIIRHVLERRGRGFENDVPYIIAWINLDEGPRFCSNVGKIAVTARYHASLNPSAYLKKPMTLEEIRRDSLYSSNVMGFFK